MSELARLLLYLCLVPLPTLTDDVRLLAAGFFMAFLAQGKSRGRILRRSLIALFTFNLTISLGVILFAVLRSAPIDWEWLVLVNLRALTMTFLVFSCIAHVDLAKALQRWPTLVLLLTVTLGQIQCLYEILRRYRLAQQSRMIGPTRLAERYRLSAAQAMALFEHAEAHTQLVARAMRSRGVFE
ncbi:MAG: hypothetical protein N2441_09905 [Rhodocyclaceae bacterium]|nr:hypothetical protein [Rhodocyclaceae bacterium]